MNKEQFLREMEALIARLPEEERIDIMRDYEEYFAAGLESGKTESEIAVALGSPKKIARELLANYHVETASREWSFANVWKAVRSVSALAFINSVLILGAYVAGLVLLFIGWTLAVVLTLIPPVSFLVISVETVPAEIFSFLLFGSIATSGVGLLLVVLMWAVSKWFSQGFLHYLRFTLLQLKGGEQHGEKK